MKLMKTKIAAAVLLSSSLLIASSASAFVDVVGQDAKITESLQQKGVIQGISKDKFVPHGKLTGAQAVQMIVKALDLKGPNKGVEQLQPNQPWYASAKRIAEFNGIKFPDSFDWNGEIAKEQFAYILDQAISATGNYPLIQMYIIIKDSDQIDPLYSNSIQHLLLMKIAEMDEDGKFHPTASMTRMEGARMVYRAAEFVQSHQDLGQKDEQLNISFQVEKVNDEVNKVIITRHEQPHPGYGIRVAKVEFTKDNKAVVYYDLLYPEPDKSYPQVITDAKTETFVASRYKVEIEQYSSIRSIKPMHYS